MAKSDLEKQFAKHLSEYPNIPEPIQEHKFHAVRRWRFDFAWPELGFAVEIEGGTWSGGRHTRGSGFAKDCEKYNTAVYDGWHVMRFTGGQVKNKTAVKMVRDWFDRYVDN